MSTELGFLAFISAAFDGRRILRVLYVAKLLILSTGAPFRPKILNFSGQKIVFLVFKTPFTFFEIRVPKNAKSLKP